jgi:lipopolysaccharide/colanic/teichoic acid biosynthesis glycosyltransferase
MIDSIGSAAGLLLLSPLFLLVIGLYFATNETLLFSNCPGKTVLFKIIKFKTMNDKKR